MTTQVHHKGGFAVSARPAPGLERLWQRVVAAVLALPVCVAPLSAHPHVFVDGGVDLVIRDGTVLEEVRLTWLYDRFETLYILSSYQMSLNADGTIDEPDRQRLVALRSQWPRDFDGSAHLAFDDQPVPLAWPEDLDAHMIDGRLQVTFSRRLETPLDLAASPVEIGFYESTYFFAFKITEPPKLLGEVGSCAANVAYFEADGQDMSMQALLAQLSREETPKDAGVGASFADRIVVQCG